MSRSIFVWKAHQPLKCLVRDSSLPCLPASVLTWALQKLHLTLPAENNDSGGYKMIYLRIWKIFTRRYWRTTSGKSVSTQYRSFHRHWTSGTATGLPPLPASCIVWHVLWFKVIVDLIIPPNYPNSPFTLIYFTGEAICTSCSAAKYAKQTGVIVSLA